MPWYIDVLMLEYTNHKRKKIQKKNCNKKNINANSKIYIKYMS